MNFINYIFDKLLYLFIGCDITNTYRIQSNFNVIIVAPYSIVLYRLLTINVTSASDSSVWGCVLGSIQGTVTCVRPGTTESG
jgi:hypothetical protein